MVNAGHLHKLTIKQVNPRPKQSTSLWFLSCSRCTGHQLTAIPRVLGAVPLADFPVPAMTVMINRDSPPYNKRKTCGLHHAANAWTRIVNIPHLCPCCFVWYTAAYLAVSVVGLGDVEVAAQIPKSRQVLVHHELVLLDPLSPPDHLHAQVVHKAGDNGTPMQGEVEAVVFHLPAPPVSPFRRGKVKSRASMHDLHHPSDWGRLVPSWPHPWVSTMSGSMYYM